MLWGANYVIPSGFCLSRLIFYNPAIPSGLKVRNINYQYFTKGHRSGDFSRFLAERLKS